MTSAVVPRIRSEWVVAAIVLSVAATARAEVDPKCAGLPRPGDYDEQVQQDFLQNHFALTATLSPIHGPIPHRPGHGAVGLDLAVIPPLGCERRYVLDWTKTENTNIAPALPRPRATFALPFPLLPELVPYGGLAYVPPVTVFGTRNVIVSVEAGLGYDTGSAVQVGGRFHATTMKTVADVATAFTPEEPAVDDLYFASTFGFDAMVGYAVAETVVPYLAVGYTDASTFFLVGDDLVVVNNFHPYSGPAMSLGVDGLVKKYARLGAELYAAPGGYSRPDPDAVTVDRGSRYGHLYTARFRFAVEL